MTQHDCVLQFASEIILLTYL